MLDFVESSGDVLSINNPPPQTQYTLALPFFSPPSFHTIFLSHVCMYVVITAVPISKLFAWGEGDSGGHVLRETTSRGLCGLVCPSRTGTREEPGSSTQGGALLSLVPLVWESNPKLQGGWCKPNHQPIGGSDPNHQGIWSPPRAGLGPVRNPVL